MKKIFTLFALMTAVLFGTQTTQAAEKEIYAVLSTDSKTMTLYYDDQSAVRGGTTTWNSYGGTVESVELDESMKSARPTSTQGWFWNFKLLTSITNLDYLNTEEVTVMRAMFSDCEVLKTIDVTNFNTGKVTNMANMFRNCYALTSINVNSFDVSNVTSFTSMFQNSGIETIYCDHDWSGIAASSSNMFEECFSLVGENGTKYTELRWTDVDYYNTAKYARPDEEVKSGFFTALTLYTEFVESTGTLTYYYDDKKSSRTGTTVIYDPKSSDIRYSTYCEKIVTAVLDESMKDAPLSSTKFMFSCGRTPSSTLKNLTKIQHLEYLNTSRVTDMSYMFAMCRSLESIDLSEFNTSNVTTMEGMFGECNALKSLNLNSFDVSDVQNVSQMFYNCTALTTIYCDSNWYDITPSAKSDKMFYGCTQLVGEDDTPCDGTNNIDITYARPDKPANSEPGYFTIEPGDIYALVSGTTMTLYYDKQCKDRGGLTDWSGYRKTIETIVFDPLMTDVRPKSTSRWFKDFESLTKIEHLNYLNTSKVMDMSGMFSGVSSLQTIDVSTFDISKVTDMSRMFEYCESLKTIYCDKDWSTTTAVSDEMFKRCAAIVGENGTIYKPANPDDATYAHLDETGNPGYFTKKKPTALDEVNLKSDITNHKFIKDGRLFIERDGMVYTITGQIVK